MAAYSELIARLAGFPEARCALIRSVAPLHDLGKVAIADRVLLKRGALTAKERTIMKTHADVGYRLLTGSGSETLELAATIARSHHERFDGRGYPCGLRGDDIPVEGRIVAIADCFDALTANRTYRNAVPIAQALEVMREDAGHFDPEMFATFADHFDEVLQIWSSFNADTGGA